MWVWAMPFDGANQGNRLERLAKIDQVIDLLSHEEKWCKQQLRSYDGRRCLLGAMMTANATVALREPVLLAIRQVTGHYHPRIELFNDHPATTHKLLMEVLNRARSNIVEGTADGAPATPVPGTILIEASKPLARLQRTLH